MLALSHLDAVRDELTRLDQSLKEKDVEIDELKRTISHMKEDHAEKTALLHTHI